MGLLQNVGVALTLIAGCAALESRSAERVFQIGVLFNALPESEIAGPVPAAASARAFVEGLRELGWVDRRNVRIHWRTADQQYERRPALIEELVRLPVDVLVIGGNYTVEEALRKTKTLPVVTIAVTSAVENRYVASLARPGGNLTGLSVESGPGLHGKRLALLKQAAPRATKVVFLTAWYTRPEVSLESRPETLEAARTLGIEVFHQKFDSVENIERAVDEAARRGANAIFVTDAQPFSRKENQARVMRAAERLRLPAVYCFQGSSDNGGLLTYSEDLVGRYRRAAYFVDRILKGSKPGDLPIEQPSTFELTVNLRAARAIGLVVPESVLAQADRVID